MENIKLEPQQENGLTADEIEQIAEKAQEAMIELHQKMNVSDYERAKELCITISNFVRSVSSELDRKGSELSAMFKDATAYDIVNISEKELSIIAEKIKQKTSF